LEKNLSNFGSHQSRRTARSKRKNEQDRQDESGCGSAVVGIPTFFIISGRKAEENKKTLRQASVSSHLSGGSSKKLIGLR
jgi:hypothetical protein